MHKFFLQCDQYAMLIDNQKSICFQSMIHFLTQLVGICLALLALRHIIPAASQCLYTEFQVGTENEELTFVTTFGTQGWLLEDVHEFCLSIA